MSANLTIRVTRNTESGVVTFGRSATGKASTVTGTIVDCVYETKVRSGKEVDTINVGDTFFGVVLTVVMPDGVKEQVIAELEEWFANNEQMGVTDPHVGLNFEVAVMRSPISGTNPNTGEPSLNCIIQNPTFLGVTAAAEAFNLEKLIDTNAKAAEIGEKASESSLARFMAKKSTLLAAKGLEQFKEEDSLLNKLKNKNNKK